MKEKLEQEKQDLREELGEFKLQMKLGKAEAVDYIEEKKDEFSGFVNEVKDSLVGSGSIPGEALTELQEKLDELKLQLALGRMESHDAYLAQREKISDAIDGVQSKWKKLEVRGKDDLENLQDSFAGRSKSFRTKLESAAISLGAGTMLATHEIEDAVRSLDERLHRIAEMTGEEIREVRKYVRSRIDAHTGK